MKELLEKFKTIEMELSEEEGNFNLFALFLREESANKWDLLVSADWIINDQSDSLKTISAKVQEHLDNKEIINLSRIVLIKDNNPALQSLQESIHIEHGCAEIKDGNFFGLQIKHAYIITSRKTKAEVS